MFIDRGRVLRHRYRRREYIFGGNLEVEMPCIIDKIEAHEQETSGVAAAFLPVQCTRSRNGAKRAPRILVLGAILVTRRVARYGTYCTGPS